MTSNIAYVLLNKDQKIQGISSSCMPMMNLDLAKMRKLLMYGIDMNHLAPNLFNNEMDSQFLSKQGGMINFRVPDFDKKKKLKRGMGNSDVDTLR